MDMDSELDINKLAEQMENIDSNSYFIYFSEDRLKACSATELYANYFLLKPINTEKLIKILLKIKNKIKNEHIVIKTANGERRVAITDINYINIVKRCLCYHLKEGSIFDGQTLRASFEKTIDPLHLHDLPILFLAPSFLINVAEIIGIEGENILFENGDNVFVS